MKAKKTRRKNEHIKSLFSGIDGLSRSFTPGEKQASAVFADAFPRGLSIGPIVSPRGLWGSFPRCPSPDTKLHPELAGTVPGFVGSSCPKAYSAVPGEVLPTLVPPGTLNHLEPLAQAAGSCSCAGTQRSWGAFGELVTFLLPPSSRACFAARWRCAGSGRCSNPETQPRAPGGGGCVAPRWRAAPGNVPAASAAVTACAAARGRDSAKLGGRPPPPRETVPPVCPFLGKKRSFLLCFVSLWIWQLGKKKRKKKRVLHLASA